jgi:hypothetical protein
MRQTQQTQDAQSLSHGKIDLFVKVPDWPVLLGEVPKSHVITDSQHRQEVHPKLETCEIKVTNATTVVAAAATAPARAADTAAVKDSQEQV